MSVNHLNCYHMDIKIRSRRQKYKIVHYRGSGWFSLVPSSPIKIWILNSFCTQNAAGYEQKRKKQNARFVIHKCKRSLT